MIIKINKILKYVWLLYNVRAREQRQLLCAMISLVAISAAGSPFVYKATIVESKHLEHLHWL